MWHWLVSITPIAVLFSSIAFFRIRIPLAATLGLLATVITATVLNTLTMPALAGSISSGLSAAFSILYAVWPAIFLYEFMQAGRSFTVLKDAAVAQSHDHLILVLFFGWIFSSFLQSITGFGVPVAVCAPFLIALGVRPIPAVTMTLIGHAWANTYGTLGMAWDALVTLGPVSNIAETSLISGLFLWIVNFTGALLICFFYGRLPAIRHALPFVVVISTVMAGGQVVVGQFNPTIAAFVPTAVALVLALVIFKLRLYTQSWSCPSPVTNTAVEGHEILTSRKVIIAGVPFIFLVAISLTVFTIPPISNYLASISVADIPVFHHAGTVLSLTALFALISLLATKQIGGQDVRAASRKALGKLISTSLGIVLLLVMARLLFTTGHIEILAYGVANVAGYFYLPFAAPIGTFGAFVTSSNMSSNILLASFQNEVAGKLAVNPSLLLAAQTAGGAAGAVIGPSTILLGATTAGVQGQEGTILRPLLVVSMAQAALIGIVLSAWVILT